ncbi:FAD-dependent oxidoreductase [Sulfurovum sp. XGS-02]|uniref:FAD-dependent oxidoreductase n=1 Tax=Sulfurovum sp. XGS-02 TaxID=2925411 RepID=UPI00205800A0|nr:FAD-dependent oxidoreductase [Sulfurovum sp. XGS-02]UPT76955.1 FAD-dependent oxidoreductase [Sulfurovum sp. XGS-02]
MFKTYDTIIIGAGIAGASTAYALKQKGQNVIVLDKRGIASGGSGAAGAFVSPKIGKGSLLQSLTNEAFEYAKEFYLSTCLELFHQTGVIRIPKDEVDAQKFSSYEPYNDNRYETYAKEQLKRLGINTEFDSFYFPEAGVCDAQEVCKYLLTNIEVVEYEVREIYQENELWCVGEYRAQNLVLATGYENDLADLRYMGIKGTWGTRGDFSSKLSLDVSMHQSISVGANVDGIIKLGATHEKGVKEVVPCKKEQALGLKEKASSLIDTSDLELKEVFCGMRSGSKDYFPLVGKVIDVPFMLEKYPAIMRGSKPEMKYIERLYVLNGLGGRGFVFAPLMAKILAESIIEGKEVDVRVDPDRLFLKWCRKSPELDALR